jgi:hypothetical protein
MPRPVIAARARVVAAATAAALCLAVPAARAGGGRVVVWPRGPGDDVAGVEAKVRGAGFEPVSFDRVRDRLRALGDRARAAEAAALDALGAALVAARAHYLSQDFGAMAAVLEQAEAAALPVIAEPRHLP